MKKLRNYLFILAIVPLLGACIEDSCDRTVTYSLFEPQYLSYEEFRASFEVEPARPLRNPGKIYFKDTYIYISEIEEGIHIIDNKDPQRPINLAFVNIPGNRDIAAKGEVLYADSHVDMLILDISNPAKPGLLRRLENAFPYPQFLNGYTADPAKGVVKEWKEEKITEKLPCDGNGAPIFPPFFRGTVDLQSGAKSGGPEVSTGVGGSMARFTIVDDYLYTVTRQQMMVFDISTLEKPNKLSEPYIGWDIETVFPYKDHLFIGGQSGMHIYSIKNRTAPEFISLFQHARNCDPVVVEGDYAYVTLRSGNPECDGFSNQLDVVDIKDLYNPSLLKTYPMKNPHGLGIRDTTLFVCDGDDGLKVYDARDKKAIDQNQLAHFKKINAFDVIPLYNILLMIGEDGLYQYDYSNVKDIRLLSLIPVEKE